MCDWCDGKGTMPLADAWHYRKEREAGKAPKEIALRTIEIPCPECRHKEAEEWVWAKVERDGIPYDNAENGYSFACWERETGEKMAVLAEPNLSGEDDA